MSISQIGTKEPKISLGDSYELKGSLAFLSKNFISCTEYVIYPEKHFNLIACVESNLSNVVLFKVIKNTTEVQFYSDISLTFESQSEVGRIQLYDQLYLFYPSSSHHIGVYHFNLHQTPFVISFYRNLKFKKTGKALENITFNIEDTPVSDFAISVHQRLIYIVLRNQGVLTVSLDNLSTPSLDLQVHDFTVIKNARQIALNTYVQNSIIVTTVPDGEANTNQWGNIYECSITYPTQTTTAQLSLERTFFSSFKCIMTSKNGPCKHQVRFPTRTIALVIAPVSFAFAARLNHIQQTTIASLNTVGAFTAAQTVHIDLQNKYFGIVSANSFNYNLNSYKIVLSQVNFIQYKVAISPNKQFIGNFNAKIRIQGQECSFPGHQAFKRDNPDELCVLNAQLSIEVLGLEVSATDWILIGVLTVLVVGLFIVIVIITAKLCSLRRKKKKLKYHMGIPDQIQLQFSDKEGFEKGKYNFDTIDFGGDLSPQRQEDEDEKQQQGTQKENSVVRKIEFEDQDLEQPQQLINTSNNEREDESFRNKWNKVSARKGSEELRQ